MLCSTVSAWLASAAARDAKKETLKKRVLRTGSGKLLLTRLEFPYSLVPLVCFLRKRPDMLLARTVKLLSLALSSEIRNARPERATDLARGRGRTGATEVAGKDMLRPTQRLTSAAKTALSPA